MADNQWRSPRGGPRGHWSPGFRGNNKNFNSPGPGHYGGGGGGRWQRSPSPSPYRYQNQSPFRPPHFATSTPIHHQHRGEFRDRPYFRGRGGGGNRFNSPRFNQSSSGEQGIDAWVSPQMWEDPWKEFTYQNDPGSESASGVSCSADHVGSTKFASLDSSFVSESESDSMNMNPSLNLTAELGISDMILTSTSGLETPDSSALPLPDYTLAGAAGADESQTETDQATKKGNENEDLQETEKTKPDSDGISAKDLLTLITS